MPFTNSPIEEGWVFEPKVTQAMFAAFEEVCREMNVPADASGRRNAIATRIIQLARSGELEPRLLCDRLLSEALSAARRRGRGRPSTAEKHP